MKKIIALLMLLIMTLAFVSCGSTPEPTPTPAPADDGGNDEPAPEPARQLTIGFNTNDLTNETMSFMVDVFYKYGEENNIKIMVSQDNQETSVTMNNIENMVSAGVDGIIFMNWDPTGIEPTVQELVDKGIAVISYDEFSEHATYSFICPNYDLGYAIGTMAANWANDAIDDEKIVFGLMSGEINEATINRSQGIEDGFKDNCPRAEVYRAPATFPTVDCFYNMYSARPDIKVFASLADSMVVGIAEAWYADLVGAGEDISEYGVFSTDATDIALNLVNQAKQGKGIFRGTIDLGLKDVVPLSMITACHKAILGEESGFEKTSYYNIKMVTEANIDEYSEFLD
ncbi:MAG: sugar ABC transporter substrate-binding protein [Oscillospiraceae bacterium]|nr:sugar ABC transporter substrate-binding protein [Oscillospiraceae bacterium]